MACRVVAEKGLDRWSRNKLAKCIEEGEVLTKQAAEGDFDGPAWRQMNNTFHATIIDAAGNPFLKRQIEQIIFIPVAMLFVVADWGKRENAGNIDRAQVDHINILDALERRQSARAEVRMREHLENTGRVIQEFYEHTQKQDENTGDQSVA